MNNHSEIESSSTVLKYSGDSGLIRNLQYYQKSLRLELTMLDGTTYQYFNVPLKTVDELKESENPDNYYRNYIRYKYKRLFKKFSYWQ